MDTEMARALFGMSLGFHIIFATLGVGLPLMIGIAEVTAALTHDSDYALLAKRWTKGFVILLGVGVVTGTIIAVQLSLLWPGFMRMVGQVIALPFLIEVFAFFLEAVFTAVYIYAADRVRPAVRITSAFMAAFGAAMSAVLITDVNAFMNTPRGFSVENGEAVDIHPWQAVFNPAFPTEALHVLSSAYMTVAFVLAAIAAYKLLTSIINVKAHAYHQKALSLMLAIGGVMAVITAFMGDISGKFLAAYQPVKLAAAEGLFQTMTHAPLVVGGIVDEASRRVIAGVELPGLLSWLATGSFDGLVVGLDHFPKSEWPPLYVHLLFDAMVAVGSACIAVAVLAWLVKTVNRKRSSMFPRWMLWLVVASGPLALLGIEFGWVFAEIARQPWTIVGLLRTVDAVTTSPHIGEFFGLFLLLYLVLAVGTVLALTVFFRRNPLHPDSLGVTDPKREVWLP